MAGLLVETQHIASRVAKPRRDLGGVGADSLNNLAPMSDNGIDLGRNAVDKEGRAPLVGGLAPKPGGRTPELGGPAPSPG